MGKNDRILLLGPDLTLPGGISNYFNTLKLESSDNINYFSVNKGKSKPAFALILRLIANYFRFTYEVIRGRYALIHINPSLDRKSFYRDSVFIILARLLNRKTLVFFRGWLDTYEAEIKRSSFKSFLFKVSYAKAHKYIVFSGIFKLKLIAMGVPADKDFFIETTVADSAFINDLDLCMKYFSYKEKVIFLFLAKVEKAKGIYIVIDAYREFLLKNPDRKSTLIVAGTGPDLSAVKKYVAELNIPDVHFPGYITADNKRQILLKSHVMILPSYTEGLPNSILEGMLYGMPIVSREVGGIPEVIKQQLNGYLSESLQPSVFAGFLSLLATDWKLYKQIAVENHSLALERFTSEKVRERIFNIYAEC